MKSVAAAVALLSTTSMALPEVELAKQGAHLLEESYVADCQENSSPHGYYGAFLQPCSFTFWKQTDEKQKNPCSEDGGKLLSKPVPLHWYFNVTEHMQAKDWTSMQDFKPPQDELLLWPDQCVGVTPRCYAIGDAAIADRFVTLFDGKQIPEKATHVQVDCRADAMALSKMVYSLADGLDQSATTLFVWVATLVLTSSVLAMWCCLCCVKLCCCRGKVPKAVAARSHRRVHNRKKYQTVDFADAEVAQSDEEAPYRDYKPTRAL